MGFEIGISGLEVAQKAISLIATNIANATTEGYHRQSPVIDPKEFRTPRGDMYGGAEIRTNKRHMDGLLEKEILRQVPLQGQTAQELQTLRNLEAALGDVDGENISAAMGRYFGALQELSADPHNLALRQQVVWAADSLTGQFNNLSTFMQGLADSARKQVDVVVDQVNALAVRVAELNQEIATTELSGGTANLPRDKRDQSIKELAFLMDVRVEAINLDKPMSDIMAWGMALVTGRQSTQIEAGTLDGGTVGLSVKDANYFTTEIGSGQLGGLMSLINEVLPDIQAELDGMARQIISEVNALHVQGLGTAGPFTELSGVVSSPEAVSAWSPPVTAGDFRIRVTDAAGATTVHTVSVVDTDTLASVAGKIAALDPANLTATSADLTLRLQALNGATFDFLPVSNLDTSGLAGPTPPAVTHAGVYTGTINQTYTLTASVPDGGVGKVGVDQNILLEVRNGAGELIRSLNVGLGYPASDALELDQGVTIAVGVGKINDGEVITLDAVARSDETGLLAAAGINTFFRGWSAGSIAVRQDVLQDSTRVASALSADLNDNTVLLKMADVGRTAYSALSGATPADAFRGLATQVGEQISIRQARADASASVVEQLNTQRDAISGVDINDEAVRLIVFERMFQSMAKVINVQQEALEYLINLL